jgi:hypothetical protein
MPCKLEDYILEVYYPQAVCAGLSVIFSILIIFTYFSTEGLQIYYLKIVVFIAFTDGLRSILYIIPPGLITSGLGCYTIAILDTALALNLIIWTLLISVILYQVIINSKENFEKYEKVAKITSFVLSGLYFLPLTTKSYNYNGTMCTYQNSLAGNLWRLFLYSLPAWTFSLISVLAFIKIFVSINRIGLKEDTKELIITVAIYPILLFIVLLFITIVRTIEIFDTNNCIFLVFYFISMILTAIQGFLNAIIFFTTPIVRQSLKLKLRQRKIYATFVNTRRHKRLGTEINLLESTDSFVNQVY